MTKYLFKCEDCGEYGIVNPEYICRLCGGKLINPRPPKFSLVDKYAKYRIEYFKEQFDKKLEGD